MVSYREVYSICKEGEAGFLAHLFYKRITALIAWILLNIKKDINPNHVTLFQYIILIGTVLSLVLYENLILFCIFLIIHDIFDGIDGTVARFTRRCSNVGAFLDAVTDRVILFLSIFLITIKYKLYLLSLAFFSLEALWHVAARYYDKYISEADIHYDSQRVLKKGKIVIGPTNDILYNALLLIVIMKIPLYVWILFLFFSFWSIRVWKILKVVKSFRI